MSHARIEELSDSDSDPPEDDLSSFVESDIIRSTSSVSPPTSSATSTTSKQPRQQTQPAPRQSSYPNNEIVDGFNASSPPPGDYQTYQCLYPVYFDANRTRAEGRRVGKDHAVSNPLAREIVDAAQNLGLKVVFEPGKMHPKDWSNPGRVRVGLKSAGSSRVKNKHHLYNLVAAHLKSHPSTPNSPLRVRIHGMPPPNGPPPAPAVPKGWKLNSILPLHSPAISGGGVSDNILKDMMQEMSGASGGNPMASLMGDMGGQDPSGGSSGAGGGGGQGKRKREGGKKK